MRVKLDPCQVLFMQSNEACIVCLHPIADVMMTWGECLLAWGGGTNLERKVLWGDQKWKIQLGGTWPIGGTLDYDGGTSNP